VASSEAQIRLLSWPQPVPLVASACSSAVVHKRAPKAEQTFEATENGTALVHVQLSRSLSPHTTLPNRNGHPSVPQSSADRLKSDVVVLVIYVDDDSIT